MQEYVEERTIAISVKAAKLSGKVLAAACKKVFSEIAKQQEAAKRPKGRQSVRKLMNHHGGKNAILFNELVLSDKLFEHCAEIDEAARNRMELIVPELAKRNGVTEKLKADTKWNGYGR